MWRKRLSAMFLHMASMDLMGQKAFFILSVVCNFF